MERIRVDLERPATAVARAAKVLRDGGIVAVPTETVYGLCVAAGNHTAVRRLYRIKGRDAAKACAILLPDAEAAKRHVDQLPPIARRLAGRFWPGPLTLVVPGRDGSLVGLRLPSLELPRAVADVAGTPLLQTSANLAGEPAALNAAAVADQLGAHIDLLLDARLPPGGRASTVVKCEGGALTVLRRGAIPDARILVAATELTLVACTGNLCRSPLAEALFRKALAERFACQPEQVVRFGHRFASFGTMGLDGRPATEESVVVGREHGVDLTPHRSRPFSVRLVKSARRVYCLGQGHLDFLRPYFAPRPDDLQMLDPKGREIADPYGRPLKVYRRAGELIRKAVEARADELLEIGRDES